MKALRYPFLVLACWVFGCHGPTPEPSLRAASEPSAEAVEAPRPRASFPPADAPVMDACAVDADCVANTPPAADGCCNEPTRLVPLGGSYRSWLSQWREANCGAVSCPPSPPPSRPAACALAVTCVEGHCQNGCDDTRAR